MCFSISAMSAREELARIPVRVEGASPERLHGWRRVSQYLTLAVLVLIPVSGLFRIDPVAGAFVLLDRQIWFSDILIVMGFWVFVASLLVLMYSAVGAVFCGWMCPQNTVSEWANAVTRRLLGRRAKVMDLSGERMQVAARRKSWLNYALLGLLMLAAAMVYALIPLLYFYPPSAIWSFITFRPDPRLASSLHWIYFVCVAVMLLDIAVIRHLMCKYMCIYRVWQHSFKTRETLHIAYDASRSADCENCRYCVDACFLDIDPRKTEVFSSCVNCGECIVACDRLHRKSRKLKGPGLLRFAFGADENQAGPRGWGAIGSLIGRARVASTVAVLSGILFAAGIYGYQPADFSVFRAEKVGSEVRDFRINLAWKLYRPGEIRLRVLGLPEGSYRLERDAVHFASAGRQDVMLHLEPGLGSGVHRFSVEAASGDWRKRFPVVYYAGAPGGGHG